MEKIIFHHKIQANTQKNQMQIFGDIQPARKEQKKTHEYCVDRLPKCEIENALFNLCINYNRGKWFSFWNKCVKSGETVKKKDKNKNTFVEMVFVFMKL